MKTIAEILVIPFIKNKKGNFLYATFLCNGDIYWAPITGGVFETETFLQACVREVFEETGIRSKQKDFIKLTASSMIPAPWLGLKKPLLIPERCFGLPLMDMSVSLSQEHSQIKWLPFQKAFSLYRYEAHKIALWELDNYLKKSDTLDFKK